MKLGIFYKAENAQSVRIIRKLKRILTERKIEYCDLEQTTCSQQEIFAVDLVVVFGGDGSVLRAAELAVDKTPIVAINTGNVGFLTSYEKDELEEFVGLIKNNQLKFTERRLLAVSCGSDSYYALNDAVIIKDYQSDLHSGCVKLELTIDGKHVDNYLADGLVFSTPTGSTAYALSCGGPIMTPDISALLVAPICAHSLHSRPIVFSDKLLAMTKVCEDSPKCALYIDGKYVKSVEGDEVVKVILAQRAVRICDNNQDFFDRLNKKIISWSANGAQDGENDG